MACIVTENTLSLDSDVTVLRAGVLKRFSVTIQPLIQTGYSTATLESSESGFISLYESGIKHTSYCGSAIPSSSSCFASTTFGASLIRQDASLILGNAITSRMESSFAISIISRSSP